MATIDLYDLATPITSGGLPYDQRTPPLPAQYNYTIEQFHRTMHGEMGPDNWFGDDVEARHLQKGAAASCWTAGGTAALDYPGYLFSAVDETWDGLYEIFEDFLSFGDGPPGQKYAVPGLSQAFYLEKDSHVLITWNFEAIIDCFGNGDLGDERAAFGLVVDKAHAPSNERIVGPSKEIDVSDTYTSSTFYGYARSRRWGGHVLTTLGKGWHDAGIYVTAGAPVRLTRIRTRGIQIIAFTET